jgi:hypothetical protein
LNTKDGLKALIVIPLTTFWLLLASGTTLAGPLTGAIYTTKFDGTTVNQNIYSFREDVYINGGPQNTKSAGLPDGTYFFQVTDPSGKTLLSTDPAIDRQLVVVNGRIDGALGSVPAPHLNGVFNPANGSMPVQLFPFDFTPNPGGEYKVWLIAETSHTFIDPIDPRVLHFLSSDSKTDNFKVLDGSNGPPPGPPGNTPEPASVLLWGLGVAGFGLYGYRSRRRSVAVA